MRSQAPIGIFDSGSGGLSIWQTLATTLRGESTVYFGDHAHLPYGGKDQAYIRNRVGACLEFLKNRGVKLIVIACNTATIAGIDSYRSMFPDIPIVGVVPVIKTAAEKSKLISFAVLSTEFTAKSVYQQQLINQYAAGCQVYSLGSEILVPEIEKGDVHSEIIRAELERLLVPIRERIDVVALGCTHFPFVASQVRAIVGSTTIVLDSSGAVVRQVARILEHNKLSQKSEYARHEFFTSGDAEQVTGVAGQLINQPIQFIHESL